MDLLSVTEVFPLHKGPLFPPSLPSGAVYCIFLVTSPCNTKKLSVGVICCGEDAAFPPVALRAASVTLGTPTTLRHRVRSTLPKLRRVSGGQGHDTAREYVTAR